MKRKRRVATQVEAGDAEAAAKKPKTQEGGDDFFGPKTLRMLRKESSCTLQTTAKRTLTEQGILHALEIVRQNPRMQEFVLNTNINLGPEAGKAVGELRVASLELYPVSCFTSAGRKAFIEALANNGFMKELKVGSSNLDTYDQPGSCDESFKPEASISLKQMQAERQKVRLPPLELQGREEDDDESEEEEDKADKIRRVFCDKCSTYMQEDDIVFSSEFDLDFCNACQKGLAAEIRETLRQTTAKAKLDEVSDSEAEADDAEEDEVDDGKANLKKEVIAFHGTLKMGNDQAKKAIEAAGGKTSDGLTDPKTTMIVSGNLRCHKLNKPRKMGTVILDEDGFKSQFGLS